MLTEFNSPSTKNPLVLNEMDIVGYERIFDSTSYYEIASIHLGNGENKSDRIDNLDKKGVYNVYIIRTGQYGIYSFGYRLRHGCVIADAAFLTIKHNSKCHYGRSWHTNYEYEIIPQDIIMIDTHELCKDSSERNVGEPIQKKSYHIEASKIIRLCTYEELYSAFAHVYKRNVIHAIETNYTCPYENICHVIYGINLSKDEGKLIVDFYTNEYYFEHIRAKEYDVRVEYDELRKFRYSVKLIIDGTKIEEVAILNKICDILRIKYNIYICETMDELTDNEIESATAENFMLSDVVGRANLGKYVSKGEDFEIGKKYRLFASTSYGASSFWTLRGDLAVMFSEIDFDKCVLSVIK